MAYKKKKTEKLKLKLSIESVLVLWLFVSPEKISRTLLKQEQKKNTAIVIFCRHRPIGEVIEKAKDYFLFYSGKSNAPVIQTEGITQHR